MAWPLVSANVSTLLTSLLSRLPIGSAPRTSHPFTILCAKLEWTAFAHTVSPHSPCNTKKHNNGSRKSLTALFKHNIFSGLFITSLLKQLRRNQRQKASIIITICI
jgi:hypothetical protein